MLNETCDLYVHLYIALSLYSAGVRFVAAYCRGRETQRRDQRSVSQLKSVISFQESGQLSILKHQLTALWESKCLYCLTLVVLCNIIESKQENLTKPIPELFLVFASLNL